MGKDRKEIPVTLRLTVAQGDTQNLGTFLRILSVHLIEVTRAHENHRIRMLLLQVIHLPELCGLLVDGNLLGTLATRIRLQGHYQGLIGLHLTQLQIFYGDGSALVQPYALISKGCIHGFHQQGRCRRIIIDIHMHPVGIVNEHLRREPLRRLRERPHQRIHDDDLVFGIASPQVLLVTVAVTQIVFHIRLHTAEQTVAETVITGQQLLDGVLDISLLSRLDGWGLLGHGHSILFPQLSDGSHTDDVRCHTVRSQSKGRTVAEVFITGAEDMAGISVHERLNVLRLLCIEVAEITIDDGWKGIVGYLDGIDIHGDLLVFRCQQFLHLADHLLAGFLRQFLQGNRVLVVVGILAVLKHLDITANGHGMAKDLILFLHAVIKVMDDNRQTQRQRNVVQLHFLGQTAHLLYCGLLL